VREESLSAQERRASFLRRREEPLFCAGERERCDELSE